MDSASLDEISDSLVRLTRAPGRDSKADPPLNHLRDTCPALLDLVSEAMAAVGVPTVDSEKATKELLETLVLGSKEVTVKQAGDLLGLAPDDEVRKAWQDYVKEDRSDAPKRYVRFNIKIRQVMAASRNNVSVTTNASKEKEWMRHLVVEFSTYLNNQDGKLTDFARDRGYPPPTEEGQAGVQGTVYGSHETEKPPPATQPIAPGLPPAAEPWTPPHADSSRGPKAIFHAKWLLIGSAIVVLVLAAGAFFVFSSRPNAVQLEGRYDGKDPRGAAGTASRCSDPPPSRPVASSNPPVFGVDGKIVGHIELRTSKICPVIWARVIWNGGPDAIFRIPSGWTLHIVAHRPETKTSRDSPDVPSENPIQYGLSSMLVTVRGCVYVEVYFSKSDRKTAVARTSCVKR